jgi:putative pyruvate formate lyase activating enzyme
MTHFWEEPCISGTRGSGAVFFCGCPLKCAFCQNFEISRRNSDGNFKGSFSLEIDELSEVFLDFQRKNVHNINLVSPTQYAHSISKAVLLAKERGLTLPVVWNTGGYEKAETVRSLSGVVDVFLTDIKYFSPTLSAELSSAADYFDVAFNALLEMLKLSPSVVYGKDGTLQSGVIVRHLILPGQSRDSMKILEKLKEAQLESKILLSVMSQYTPDFFSGTKDETISKNLKRRVTTFEAERVTALASELSFSGYSQDRASASNKYTPKWGE